jgi:hypothetical protein
VDEAASRIMHRWTEQALGLQELLGVHQLAEARKEQLRDLIRVQERLESCE